MNLRVLVLALGAFAVGTGTFIVTGLLGSVAVGFSVSLGAAGSLVTVFAITYALVSPVLVTLTGHVARRRLLVSSLALFCVANLAAALAPTFPLLLLARAASACGAAVCLPVASSVAAELAPPESKGRALSAVLGGTTVAWVVGIPLGTLVGDEFGWRASFALVAILALGAAAGVGVLLPNVRSTASAGLASRMAVAARPPVFTTLAVTALCLTASFVALTYVRPLLEALTGFGTRGIGGMLLLFGLASIAGTVLGGLAADRRSRVVNRGTILTVLIVSLLSFSVLWVLESGSAIAVAGAGAALAAWSVSGFAIIPLQQYRLIGEAPGDANTVLSLNASAVYLGQGAGAAIGSFTVLQGSLASLGWVGASCAAASLGVLALSGGRRP